MGLKKAIFDLAKKSPAFRKSARLVRDRFKKMEYVRNARKIRVDRKTIYFETFSGRSYADSPKAIYEHLLADPRFSDYLFVWSFFEPEKYKFLEENRNTKVVASKSREEEKILARAGYWITNYRMLDHFIPKAEQIYVQCWHGTPLKRLGYDLKQSDNVMNSIEEIRDKYKTDTERFSYFISPSAFATEKFRSAWNMEALGKADSVIEEGYPRNDRLINADPEYVSSLKKQFGIDDIGDKKVLLYAPTWRDNQHTSGVGYTYKVSVDFDYLREKLAGRYVILFRAHYLVANSFDFQKYDGFIYNVSDHDDVNDAYLVSDILITDYSSVFFDYANLRRPMIFYMYDMEEYRDSLRGFYISLDELPGRIVENEQDLVQAVEAAADSEIDETYERFNKKYNYLDDGHATDRVIEKIFFSK